MSLYTVFLFTSEHVYKCLSDICVVFLTSILVYLTFEIDGRWQSLHHLLFRKYQRC